MRTRTEYEIETVHPTWKPGNGVRRIEVVTNEDGTKYVCGGGLGCSRNYSTPHDSVAIASLLAEHAMRMIKCELAVNVDFRAANPGAE